MEKKSYVIEVPKHMPDYKKAFLRFVMLDGAFDKVFLQKERIKIAQRDANLKVLFADIHFFLVATTNMMEGFKSLKGIIKTDQELNSIYKSYISRLEHLDVFRDHLEHITDGRLDGFGKKNKPLKNPSMLGNIINDEYDFGGESFNLAEAFSLVEDLYIKLKEWNKKVGIYPIWIVTF